MHRHLGAAKELKKLKGLMYRLSRLERNAPLSDLSKFNSPQQTGIKELLKKCRTTQWHFYESPTPTPTRFYCILMLAKLYMSHTLVFVVLAFHMSDIEYLYTAVDSDTFSLRYILFNYNQIMYVN